MPNIDFGRGRAPGGKTGRPARLPHKPAINFAQVGVKRMNWTVGAPALLIVALLIAAFAKFLVFDRLAAVAAAQAEANAVQAQIDECEASCAKYGQLNDVYAHYTYSGMTEEELSRVDRAKILDLMDRVVFPRTPVNQWNLSGNQLTLTIEGRTLEEVNLTAQALLAEDLVSYCEINTAATDTDAARYGAVFVDPDKVSATIVVYLADPEVIQE